MVLSLLNLYNTIDDGGEKKVSELSVVKRILVWWCCYRSIV